MTRLTPLDGYQMYMALKLHFTTPSYNYIRYQGKVRIPPNAETRPEMYHIKSLLTKYPTRQQFQDFLVANFVDSEMKKVAIWPANLKRTEAERAYMKRAKVIQSLGYTVNQDVQDVAQLYGINLAAMLDVSEGNLPPLITEYVAGKIHLETLVVIDRLLGTKEQWSDKLANHVVWPEISMELDKYGPFVEFDRNKMAKVLVEGFK